MDDGNTLGIDADSFLNNSYKHWQWSRYNPEIIFSTVDQLREGKASNSTSGASVPVRYSPQPFVVFPDHAFPCICGDELGTEKAIFF